MSTHTSAASFVQMATVCELAGDMCTESADVSKQTKAAIPTWDAGEDERRQC